MPQRWDIFNKPRKDHLLDARCLLLFFFLCLAMCTFTVLSVFFCWPSFCFSTLLGASAAGVALCLLLAGEALCIHRGRRRKRERSIALWKNLCKHVQAQHQLRSNAALPDSVVESARVVLLKTHRGVCAVRGHGRVCMDAVVQMHGANKSELEQVYTHTRTHTHMQTNIHTHTHTYTQKHTYTHAHTCDTQWHKRTRNHHHSHALTLVLSFSLCLSFSIPPSLPPSYCLSVSHAHSFPLSRKLSLILSPSLHIHTPTQPLSLSFSHSLLPSLGLSLTRALSFPRSLADSKTHSLSLARACTPINAKTNTTTHTLTH